MLRERIETAIAPRHALHAHCDIPCGIYDPSIVEYGARSVARMVELMNQNLGDDPTQRNQFIRMVEVKEKYAESVKHEVRVIWGDYFKPEHVAKYPQLHDLVWRIMRQASKCKQTVDAQAAADLLALVKEFADIFWETKGGRPTA